MENSGSTRESISALVDGEVTAQAALPAFDLLREPLHRQTWDLYHQVGDTLRCESMAAPLSEDFSRRFAAKLDAEPTLSAPGHATRRRQGQVAKMARIKWFALMPAGLAAAAAAVFAFVMAPNFMPRFDADPGNMTGTFASVPPSHGALLAEAIPTQEPAAKPSASSEDYQDISQYIEVHQSSHASLYGSARLAQPTVLVTAADK